MKYYVLCPYGLVTGGPDALHQMVYYLNSIGKEAHLVYLNISKKTYDIPNNYKTYANDYMLINEVKDEFDTTIIIPEFLSYMTKYYKNADVRIWWLSVYYNFNQTSIPFKLFLLATYPLRLLVNRKMGFKNFNQMYSKALFKSKYKFEHESPNIRHICASYYAYNYVSKRTKNEVALCIEPISKVFLNKSNRDNNDRSDVILYNPKKCGKYVKKIIKKSKGLKFYALAGLSQEELIKKYQESKLYIDFGPFPGAERIPKEAVINGCAILTGKFGAAGYRQDVVIDDKYKIDATNENIKKIIEQIKYMLNNYSDIKDDFKEYADRVYCLEDCFLKQLENI